MKHPLYPAALAALLAAGTLLGGCAAAPTSLSLQEAELSEEETALLELIGAEEKPLLYEYQVDGQCRKVELRRYLLDQTDYHWEADSFSSTPSEESGRIAFLPTADGSCQVSVQSGSQISRSTYPSWEKAENAGEGSIWESESPIVYGQELPLLVQVQSGADSHSIYTPEVSWEEPETYQNANVRQAMLFTVTFCDQENCNHQ